MFVAILEDDADRRKAFEAALATVQLRAQIRDNAPDFIEMLNLSAPLLMSLDFDLFQCESKPDPGTGMTVVEHLARRTPTVPVIVHSANPKHGDPMVAALGAAGWKAIRVNPMPPDDWGPPVDPVAFIRTDWIAAVRQTLGR